MRQRLAAKIGSAMKPRVSFVEHRAVQPGSIRPLAECNAMQTRQVDAQLFAASCRELQAVLACSSPEGSPASPAVRA